MKLAFSNIAWDIKDDDTVLSYLCKKGFSGLEIAPTKLFGSDPYSSAFAAKKYFEKVKDNYGITLCSMQSLWYGKTGNIFSSSTERTALKEYTFKAIEFASAVGCPNLVFGNPKARNKGESEEDALVFDFFASIAKYAKENKTCIALEPNPSIYNTDFINTTKEAFDYCKKLKKYGLKVNVDLGTIIQNCENLEIIKENIELVNHIHISEPFLKPIVKRDIHKVLAGLDFSGYVSVEMAQPESTEKVFQVADYIAKVFLNHE